jgi:hypothetical protein
VVRGERLRQHAVDDQRGRAQAGEGADWSPSDFNSLCDEGLLKVQQTYEYMGAHADTMDWWPPSGTTWSSTPSTTTTATCCTGTWTAWDTGAIGGRSSSNLEENANNAVTQLLEHLPLRWTWFSARIVAAAVKKEREEQIATHRYIVTEAQEDCCHAIIMFLLKYKQVALACASYVCTICSTVNFV